MAKKRGLLAEINHQRKVAEREAEKKRKEVARDQARRARELAHVEREILKAENDQAKAEHERYVALQLANVELMNEQLGDERDEVASILTDTLAVDDFIDLESMRREIEHTVFSAPELEVPIENNVALLAARPEPVFVAPSTSAFGRTRSESSQQKRMERARANFEALHSSWESDVEAAKRQNAAAVEANEQAESARLAELEAARKRHADECAAHSREVESWNAELDDLINNLAFGVADAVEEYVGLVFSNTLYPESFEVSHEFTHDQTAAELALHVYVPDPRDFNSVKSYKYVKSSDEIRATELSQKAQKDFYAETIMRVALRSLHEVFEADRNGNVQTIALQVGPETVSPATGVPDFIPLLAVSASREHFLTFNLGAVEPAATMEHLGASISKNMLSLVPADLRGVRAA